MIRFAGYTGVVFTLLVGIVATVLADLVEPQHLMIAGGVLPVIYGSALLALHPTHQRIGRWPVIFYGVGALFLFPWLVLRQYFGGFSLSALLYHMQEGVQEGMPAGTILPVLAGGVVVACLLHSVWFLFRRLPKAGAWLSFAATGLVAVNPFVQSAGMYAYFVVSGQEPRVLSDLAPVRVSQPSAGKNLVLIYLEGIEATYDKPDLFENAYQKIAQLAPEALNFTGVAQMPLTAWTSAGLVASQCGVPLVPRGFASRNRIDNAQSYMPGVTCLGDVLTERGYVTEMFLGSDASFAGKRSFLETHGIGHIHDIDELIAGGADDLGNWGVLDGQLLDATLDRLSELEQTDTPYFLSLLTVGTHGPAAELASECRGEHTAIEQDDILEGVRCTAELVSQFVKAAQDVVSAEDTLIVLLSDHLAHPKVSAYWDLSKFDRTNTFMVLGGGIAPGEVSKQGAMIDAFPTLLEMMDLPSDAHRAGLGVSLLSENPSWVEGQSDWLMRQRLRMDADLVSHLWGGDQVAND
ncbi:sulfatase-like hydrolase/transferase [Aliiroseovarius sp. KMU-50]|uniref:Sulfatase-like hydrolase/transferase n=1 Tax=Aliiroseovarius salicola TaxID=3009082 RepID=A0ABT4W2G1_9RHOB|nr:sulfatase-like hydrolase/transferase [Aliiroseovarius sp. KMU-50]MDA5094709.1 sulfatase-like hydrolase/transferase [Aliiroseovarius sp. KMU-50]